MTKVESTGQPWYLRLWVLGRSISFWVRSTRAWRFFAHFTNVGGNVLTAGMSYLAIFAVFAALAVGFGLLGSELASRPEVLDTLVAQINSFVPGLLGYDGTTGAVEVESLLSGAGWVSLVAFVTLLWVTLNWFTGTRRSIRLIFGLEVREYRSAVLLKLRDFVLALLFGLAFLISAALTVLSSNITDALYTLFGWNPDSWLLGTMGRSARNTAVFVFDLLVLIAIHTLLAEVKVPFMRLLRGCALGAGALFGLKLLGSTLLTGSTSNALLLPFWVIIGLLIWFNLICRVLLLTAAWIATGLDGTLALPHDPPAGYVFGSVRQAD